MVSYRNIHQLLKIHATCPRVEAGENENPSFALLGDIMYIRIFYVVLSSFCYFSSLFLFFREV